MDHILENNDNPVPDLSSQGPASSAPTGGGGSSAMDLDDVDDDDAAAIRAALGKSSANVAPGQSTSEPAASASGGEAKVSEPLVH